MNQYVTGGMIRKLRERKNLTQSQLAERIGVSDKTVSKWETGKGYPDISLLEPIAKEFSISVAELIAGNMVTNVNVGANMLRSHFFICPVCGNVIHSMGEAVIYCHGVRLMPEEAEETDEDHKSFVECVEDEYYVQIEHEMTKQHYISLELEALLERCGFKVMEHLEHRGMTDRYFKEYNQNNPMYPMRAPKGVGYVLASD